MRDKAKVEAAHLHIKTTAQNLAGFALGKVRVTGKVRISPRAVRG